MKKAFVGMVGAFVFACACALQSCAQTTLDPVLEDIRKFDFPMWVVVLAVAVILLLGSSLAKKGEWQEDPLSAMIVEIIIFFFIVFLSVCEIVCDAACYSEQAGSADKAEQIVRISPWQSSPENSIFII